MFGSPLRCASDDHQPSVLNFQSDKPAAEIWKLWVLHEAESGTEVRARLFGKAIASRSLVSTSLYWKVKMAVMLSE